MRWWEKTRQLRIENLGQNDQNVGHAHMNTVMALLAMKRYEDALEHDKELEDLITKMVSPENRLRSGVLLHKCAINLALEKWDEAEIALYGAKQLAEQRPGWSMHSQSVHSK